MKMPSDDFLRAQKYFAILFVFSIFGTIGCGSSVKIERQMDEEFDFSSYQTYEWMTPPEGTMSSIRTGGGPLLLKIANAIDEELKARSFQEVEESPDFYVVFHASVDEDITSSAVNSWGYGYGWSHGRGAGANPADSRNYTIKQGSLVIDIVDAERDEVVWRGTATGAVDPKEVGKNVEKVVADVLKPFPPK